MAPPESGSAGILALADRAQLEGLFAQAGFARLGIEDVGFTWVFDDGDDYWPYVNDAAGALAMVVARLDPTRSAPPSARR